MANLMRPAADRRTTRRTRSRSPPPAEDGPTQAALHHHHHHHQPLRSPIAAVDTPEARPQPKPKQRRSHDPPATRPGDATKKLHRHVDASTPTSTPTPTPEDTPSAMVDKKSLRSKDPVRKASVLADIFGAHEYAEILATVDAGESAGSNVSTMRPDDQIALVDEPLAPAQRAHFADATRRTAAHARARNPPPDPSHVYTPRPPFDCTLVTAALPTTADPLADSLYTKVHKRHEGEERKSRNWERDGLQYKMHKAPAVLEDLEAEDWHKVFVIDKGAREAWEPKRAHFITELRSAIAKQDALRDVELRKRRREKAKRARERDGTDDDDESDDDHPKPSRPPRRPRLSTTSHPCPNPISPPQRRPPRPHGFILDIPPVPDKPITPFKSFYARGQRPTFSHANPSPRKATRSAAPPPFGVALPRILTSVDDERLLKMLQADQGFARSGLPTEETLLEDERSFQCFGLGGGFVTSEFLRENERKRRVRRRTRGTE